jgi:hypothetical protein
VAVGLENESLRSGGHLTKKSRKFLRRNSCFFFRVISPLILRGEKTRGPAADLCAASQTGDEGHAPSPYVRQTSAPKSQPRRAGWRMMCSMPS